MLSLDRRIVADPQGASQPIGSFASPCRRVLACSAVSTLSPCEPPDAIRMSPRVAVRSGPRWMLTGRTPRRRRRLGRSQWPGDPSQRAVHLRRRPQRLDRAVGGAPAGRHAQHPAPRRRGHDVHPGLHAFPVLQSRAHGPAHGAAHVHLGHVLELPGVARGTSGRSYATRILPRAGVLGRRGRKDLPQRPARSSLLGRLLSGVGSAHAQLASAGVRRGYGEHAALPRHVRGLRLGTARRRHRGDR
jgi:hypothetical protein